MLNLPRGIAKGEIEANVDRATREGNSRRANLESRVWWESETTTMLGEEDAAPAS